MDHEDAINHLAKFHEIFEIPRALDVEDENLYMS